jgi:hypothetical protein
MTLTVFLLWTVISGVPSDVDAFIAKEDCEKVKIERQNILRSVKNEREDLKDWEIVGCFPVQVGAPGKV